MLQESYPESTRQTYLELAFRYDSRHFSGVCCDAFAKVLRAEGIAAGLTYRPLSKDGYLEDALNSCGCRRVFSKQ